MYFTCAAAVCLACLAAYVAILPRLTPALAQKRQAALLKPKRSGMEAQVPMAQPIVGYHAATDQGEASGSLQPSLVVATYRAAQLCSCPGGTRWVGHDCCCRCLHQQFCST